MADDLPLMDKHVILERLKILSYRMNEEGIQLEMTIFGGAAIALKYDSTRITRDIDVKYNYNLEMMNLILLIAIDMDWPLNWLNSAGQFFVNDDAPAEDYFDFPGLKIKTVAPDYLLAMKIRSSRKDSRDFADTKLLIDKLGIKSREEAEQLTLKYFPKHEFKTNHNENLDMAFPTIPKI